MKCILCKACEGTKATLRKMWVAWLRERTNDTAMWEREADRERLRYVHSLGATDPEQYFKEYLLLAEGGSPWSAYCAGSAFEHGFGTAVDLVQAEKWYRLAYDAGSDRALLQLGAFYFKSRQYTKAEVVYRTGVERDLPPAMHGLALVYSKSSEWRHRRDEARTLLDRASAAGDIFAKMCLASTLARGWFGLHRIPEGFRLIWRNADEIAELLEDEERVTPEKTQGLLGHLARVCPFVANRISTSQVRAGATVEI